MSARVFIFYIFIGVYFNAGYGQQFNETAEQTSIQSILVTLDLQPQSFTQLDDNITSGIGGIISEGLDFWVEVNGYNSSIEKVNNTRFVIQIDIHSNHEITLDEVILNVTSIKNQIEMEYNVTVINLSINIPIDYIRIPYQETENTFLLVIILAAIIMFCCIIILIICICSTVKHKFEEDVEYNNNSAKIVHVNTDSTIVESPQSDKNSNSSPSNEINDDINDIVEPLQDLEPGQLQDALPLNLSPIAEEQDEDQDEDQPIGTMPTLSEAERDVMEADNDQVLHFSTNGGISIPVVIGELDEQFSAISEVEGPRSTSLRSQSLPKGLSIGKQGTGCISFSSQIAYNV